MDRDDQWGKLNNSSVFVLCYLCRALEVAVFKAFQLDEFFFRLPTKVRFTLSSSQQAHLHSIWVRFLLHQQECEFQKKSFFKFHTATCILSS